MCIRASSREKKKKRYPPSRKTVGLTRRCYHRALATDRGVASRANGSHLRVEDGGRNWRQIVAPSSRRKDFYGGRRYFRRHRTPAGVSSSTTVWLKRGGKWQVIAQESTPVDPRVANFKPPAAR